MGIATRAPNPATERIVAAADHLRSVFDRADELTVGVEEELLLVDPRSFDLVDAGPRLLGELADGDRFRSELSPAQIEIVSPVCTSAAAAVEAVVAGRRDRLRPRRG